MTKVLCRDCKYYDKRYYNAEYRCTFITRYDGSDIYQSCTSRNSDGECEDYQCKRSFKITTKSGRLKNWLRKLGVRI